jgi:hypothetical protein
MGRAAIAAAFACVAAVIGPAACAAPAPTLAPVCYDLAIVANIERMAHVDDLAMPYWGFRADLLIKVDKVLEGTPPSQEFWIQGILTHALRPSARVILYLQRGGDADGPRFRDEGNRLLTAARSPVDYRLVELTTERARVFGYSATYGPPAYPKCP